MSANMDRWYQEKAIVVKNEPTDTSMYHLRLQAPKVAQQARAGTFIALHNPASAFLLPRPFDLHVARPEEGHIEIVYRVKGRGTKALALLQAGDPLLVQGPFGLGVDHLLDGKSRIALIGRGAGISPLNFIAHAAHARQISVAAYLSARNSMLFAPFQDLRRVATTLEAWTDEDQPRRLVTDAFISDNNATPIDAAFVVGSKRLTQATLHEANRRHFPSYGFMESFMGCGFGHCKACAVPTRGGYVLACLEGPVIDLKEVSDEYWTTIPS